MGSTVFSIQFGSVFVRPLPPLGAAHVWLLPSLGAAHMPLIVSPAGFIAVNCFAGVGSSDCHVLGFFGYGIQCAVLSC